MHRDLSICILQDNLQIILDKYVYVKLMDLCSNILPPPDCFMRLIARYIQSRFPPFLWQVNLDLRDKCNATERFLLKFSIRFYTFPFTCRNVGHDSNSKESRIYLSICSLFFCGAVQNKLGQVHFWSYSYMKFDKQTCQTPDTNVSINVIVSTF